MTIMKLTIGANDLNPFLSYLMKTANYVLLRRFISHLLHIRMT